MIRSKKNEGEGKMLKLIKKGKALSKEEMLTSNGGAGNCGTMGCDCGSGGNPELASQQSHDYLAWYAKEY